MCQLLNGNFNFQFVHSAFFIALKYFFREIVAHLLSIFHFDRKQLTPNVYFCPLLSAFPLFSLSFVIFSFLPLPSLCLPFIIPLCSTPPLAFPAFLFSPARKINCPAAFRACWAITTK